MVATAILSIGIVGFFGAFRYIMTSLHVSRAHTMATNLAQQQVEILKNVSYYSLLLTTAPATIPGTAQLYDPNNYPPQTFNINGQILTVYTYVTMAQVQNNVISSVSYNYPDTGLKQIGVNVLWTDRGASQIFSLSNLLENPNVAALDSGFSGTINASGGGPLAGVLVRTQENPNWSATTDSSGRFSFAVIHGSYTLEAALSGYYPSVVSAVCSAGAFNTGITMSLLAIASGTVTGNVWYNPGLVISQVVGTTHTCTGALCTGGSVNDVEYVELFNPTTYQINVVTPPAGAPPWLASSVTPLLKINTTVGASVHSDIMNSAGANYVYVSSYVAPGGYFLFASYPTFMTNGIWVTADAYYGSNNCGGSSPTNCLANFSYGGVQILDSAGNIIDRVCWNGNGGSPPAVWCNGTAVPTDPNCGMNTGAPIGSCGSGPYEGNQLVRFAGPTVLGRTTFAGTYGSAYNSRNNAADFIYPSSGTPSTYGLQYAPFSTQSPALAIISGVPAVGAQVAATDLFSGSVQVAAATVVNAAPWSQSQLSAPFSLPGVTTGTWSIDVTTADSSNNVQFFGHIDNIAIGQGASIAVPNAATSPPWAVAGVSSVMLTSTSAMGFVKGQVTDVLGNPISGIHVQAGAASKVVGANGSYFASVSTGNIAVTANPNNLNPSYISQGVQTAVSVGKIAVANFALAQGGRITGYLSTGSSPLPQVVAVAINSGGNQAGSGTSDSTGHFYISNISSGTYTVKPVLNPGQGTSPVSAIASISGGVSSVFSASFTVTGALATLSGAVTQGGLPVTTGALIIVSTAAISTPPATILGSNANTLTPVYAVSSLADGSYSVSVAASATPYNILVSMPVPAPDGTVSMHTGAYTVSVPSPSATVVQNLAVP